MIKSENGRLPETANFESRRRAYLEAGRAALIEHGPTLDSVLQAELLRPGTDSRYGVNIICRPSEELTRSIVDIQKHLRAHEPDQYYYPHSELHLTLLEICHSRTPKEVAEVISKLRPLLSCLFKDVHSIHLQNPEFGFDTHACAVAFLPADDSLQFDRAHLAQVLTASGIPIDSRYASQSAHVTVMRYVAPLRSGRQRWVDILSNIPLNRMLAWNVFNLSVTWGPNWYGMRSHVRETGLFLLS